MSLTPCIFCKIVAGEIPAKKVFEDDDLLVFHDIHAQAPLHLLMIPKRHLENLYDADQTHAEVLGKMMTMAGKIAREMGSPDGFRLVVNNGRVGRQEVYHLHIHLLGGTEPLGSGMNRH
jgi:histidine triad (HIT) family protein